MDDAADGTYSRSPEIEDLLSLCESLNNYNVNYVLIGGFAVILHGFVRGTKDIDLLVDTSDDNVSKLKKAMAYLPDNAISLIENNEIEKYQVIRIADEIVVDLMAKACGISFNDAKAEIEWRNIENIQIPIANKELLIRMKDTLRPSDKMDIQFLKNLIQEEEKS